MILINRNEENQFTGITFRKLMDMFYSCDSIGSKLLEPMMMKFRQMLLVVFEKKLNLDFKSDF